MVATALRKYIPAVRMNSAHTSMFVLNISIRVHMKRSCYWRFLDIFISRFILVHNIGPHRADVWLSRLQFHAFKTGHYVLQMNSWPHDHAELTLRNFLRYRMRRSLEEAVSWYARNRGQENWCFL